MIKRIALLLIILTLILPVSVLGAEAGEGVIEGQLANGTKDGSSVANQEVTLKTYLNSSETGSATTKTDTKGYFAFTGLATGSNYAYQLTLTFQEAEYTGEQVNFGSGETRKFIELTVYDATNSDAAIKVATVHTVVYVTPGNLEVMELYLITNESDRTYIGSGDITTTGKRKTLTLPVASKATELQYGGELMECCILASADGLIDTMPILPGQKEIVYAYRVNYKSGTYSFSRRVSLPTDSYDFLVQGEGVKIASNSLIQGEPWTIEGKQFERLSGSNLTPGDTIDVKLSELPAVSRQETALWTVLALVIAGGGISVAYLRRKRKLQPVKVTASSNRQKLLLELAQLDDAFENGTIEEDAYRQRRAAKKSQLVRLMQREKSSNR